ncbi:MAG TPA: glycoside hydrolase family protein [Syntrophales bacterium]|nr:glycoside hydrolase family protein [Syntrophales bacterium]
MTPEDYTKRNEGIRYRPYLCSAKRITIGWGRNLQDNGISRDEAEYLFRNDWNRAVRSCLDVVPGFDRLSEPRRAVLIDMAYQLGGIGLWRFERMLAAVRRGDFDLAAREILDSKYAREDSPGRAARNAEMMRTGEWQDS